jgi:septal ring factor EnvC (AmiA/AmiB activator)
MSNASTIAAIITIAATLVGAIFGFASLWGAMREKQRAQEKKIEAIETAQACTDSRAAAQEAVIARLDENMKAVKDEMKSLNAKLDRLLDRQAAGREV